MRVFTVSIIQLFALAWAGGVGAFEIEEVSVPERYDLQVGGMDVSDGGQLVVALHRGEVVQGDQARDMPQGWQAGLVLLFY